MRTITLLLVTLLLWTALPTRAAELDTPPFHSITTFFRVAQEGALRWNNDERFISDALLVRVWWIDLLAHAPTDGTPLVIPFPLIEGHHLRVWNVDREHLTFSCDTLLRLDGSAQSFLAVLGCHPYWLDPQHPGWQQTHKRG